MRPSYLVIMAAFFPHHALDWRVHEPAALRRLTLSTVAMGVGAGITMRVYRWAMLTYASTGSAAVLFLTFAGILVILLGFATAHLGNYPVRHWLWRAPLFGIVSGLAEAAASAALIALAVEPLGHDLRAHWHDWRPGDGHWGILLSRIVWDTVLVIIFATVLAGVVQLVRYAMLKREHRDHTLAAIHEDHVRHTHEHHVPRT